jgi:hypothetical protein
MGRGVIDGMRAVAVSFVCWMLASAAGASLAPSDREALTAALRVVADRTDPEAAAAARAILRSREYEQADFEAFFASFFDGDSLTPALADWLAASTLGARSIRTRAALQEALASVLVDEIDSTFREYLPHRLGPALERSPTRFGHLSSSMQLLGRIAYEGKRLSRASRRAHYARLKRLIASHPEVLRKRVTIDTGAQPKVAALRAHLYKNMRDLSVPFDPNDFIASAGFEGPYAELVARHGVMVLDNNGFDERQLQAIGDVLALIPPNLHATTHISQHKMLDNMAGSEVVVRFVGSLGVNIARQRVGQTQSNQFPPGIESVEISGFCSVLQHELNHVVDATTIQRSPTLSVRQRELITRAGSNPLQYLRSMLADGFFEAHPQEFFASISNAYFADSLQTFRLALRRVEQGWLEPMNQFLFFAEVYSQGGRNTWFFEQDGSCNYASHRVPVGRNSNGRIDRIRWLGIDLRFELDDGGNVIRLAGSGTDGSRALAAVGGVVGQTLKRAALPGSR